MLKTHRDHKDSQADVFMLKFHRSKRHDSGSLPASFGDLAPDRT